MPIVYTPRYEDNIVSAFIESEEIHKDVLLIEGARQVGKTMLVEHALERAARTRHSVNLERDSLLRSRIDEAQEFRSFTQLLHDRLGFDPEAGHILFIDEAQESLTLGRHVRFMKEEWPHATVIITGSTLSRLFREEARYPVGRVRRLVLGPFTFSEFLRASGSDHLAEAIAEDPSASISPQRHERLLELYDAYLDCGGLPRVVADWAAAADWQETVRRIIADYEQDFIRILGPDSIGIVKACLRGVANRVGSPSTNTSVMPSPTTRQNERINEAFARLEAWHLVVKADQAGADPAASQRHLPKRYLFDTGVLRRIRESGVPGIRVLGTLDAAARTPLGGVLENQVAIELQRHHGRSGGWRRSSAGLEIDFVVKDRGAAIPLECKAALEVDGRHIRGISDYLSAYGQSVGVVVGFAPFRVVGSGTGARICIVPAYLLDSLRGGWLAALGSWTS